MALTPSPTPSRSWMSAGWTATQAGSVGDEVALAAFDLFRGIVTAWSTAFGRLDRLAINDTGRGARLAPRGLACLHQQLKIDPLKQPTVPPILEIALHRRERREILRQQPPLAARPKHLQDCVQQR